MPDRPARPTAPAAPAAPTAPAVPGEPDRVAAAGSHQPAWVQLHGAVNVRDLGGLPVEGGGLTRPGVLLRADALDALSPQDVVELAERRGVRHVVDLRSDGERRERGRGPLGDVDGVHYSELAIIDDTQLELRRDARAVQLAGGAPAAQIMAEGYVQLLDWGAACFVAAFRAVAGIDGSPAVVHCSAGKDRTGVLVALLLGAARVEPDAIVADYAATQDRLGLVLERLQGAERFGYLAESVASFAFAAPPETMRRLLDLLEVRWGGLTGWLTAHGVEPGEQRAWQGQFVTTV